MPYHPGSPEAPLLKADVLDKFERNASWLFGPAARSIAAGLCDVPHGEGFRGFVARIAVRPEYARLGAAE